MSQIKKLQEEIKKFNLKRDWIQFHNPKDMSLSLLLEASELLEHFQWKNGEDMEKYILENKDKLAEELADIFYWVVYMSDRLDIDIEQSLKKKMKKNKEKYPIEKSKGKSTKYTNL